MYTLRTLHAIKLSDFTLVILCDCSKYDTTKTKMNSMKTGAILPQLFDVQCKKGYNSIQIKWENSNLPQM